MKKTYLTTTLLNSWQYYLKSSESKEESAKESFLNCLNKIKTEPTPDMIRGLQFEQDVWDFATGKLKETDDMTVAQIAQQVSGGLWQEVVYKHFMDYKDVGIYLYGVCDVICADTIFDIKSVRNYHIGKYSNSFQHPIYFECSNQDKFIYLISDGESVFYEEYNKSPQHTQKLYNSILEFFGWLSINNLVETYLEKWDFKEKEESLNV